MTNSTPRFTRMAPDPGHAASTIRTKRGGNLVTVGGVPLPVHHAAFLTKYLERFNGAEAARAIGRPDNGGARVYASELLSTPNVRSALRGALEERRDRSVHKVDDVARHWWSIATADPRELTQMFFVPCRYCYGEGHRYQETSVEYNDRFVRYEAEQARRDVLSLEKRDALDPLPEFERAFPVTDRRWVCREFGGLGYTTNRYPMRGPDWASTVERVFSDIGRPLPEGLCANSDHSCPACHGDGMQHVWVADTRHLSPEAALLFDGVRITKDRIEIKQLDRMAAMERFEALMGMSGPQRIELTGAGGGPIDVRVKRIESRVVDADYVDITEQVVSGALPAPNGRDHSADAPKLPVVKTGIVE